MVIGFRVIVAVFAAAFSCGSRAAWAADKPNIVIILADDLGNADLGYRGSKIKTPNIDILAKGGVRLESYYGLPLCTPARAALMTGRYPMRHGLQTLVIFPSHKYGLPVDEKTLPQALKQIGYSTYMVGKWHLGHADKKYLPNSRGFDHFYGNVVGEVDYFTKDRGGVIDWQYFGMPARAFPPHWRGQPESSFTRGESGDPAKHSQALLQIAAELQQRISARAKELGSVAGAANAGRVPNAGILDFGFVDRDGRFALYSDRHGVFLYYEPSMRADGRVNWLCRSYPREAAISGCATQLD